MKTIDDNFKHLYRELPEIMQKLWELMPIGKEIALSNGRVGIIKKFYEPTEEEGQLSFGFDVVFEKGSPDHLEFVLKHTGGGGFALIGTKL
jgi:hypothetical protein